MHVSLYFFSDPVRLDFSVPRQNEEICEMITFPRVCGFHKSSPDRLVNVTALLVVQ
jgi:hypothetical protein